MLSTAVQTSPLTFTFLHLIWPANLVLALSLLSCRLDAIVDTTAYGESEVQTALDTQICSDQEMEARLNGQTFGQFPLPMALCWQRVEESSGQPKLHRLHLALTEAPRHHPRQKCCPAYPGGNAIGLLWGYALDGEKRVWEVRPYKDGGNSNMCMEEVTIP